MEQELKEMRRILEGRGSKADVYSVTDPPKVSGYLLLRFYEGRWELERI